ncbi:glyoxalase family protein [Trichophyton verrucosum HKI 0517]|uniref:Glyoxalase family protein n=1 Tax=Trichophyton verrucosum (strain HKI 0517) TaxID=663202 RepID=D4D9Z9_TRIVH|nr:glyoxalase family protein [Trichophyton verrucosum HKI 0517]EFE41295.1 glyoxalase family protein [Trichophyton verrucosum HKI 0517]
MSGLVGFRPLACWPLFFFSCFLFLPLHSEKNWLIYLILPPLVESIILLSLLVSLSPAFLLYSIYPAYIRVYIRLQTEQFSPLFCLLSCLAYITSIPRSRPSLSHQAFVCSVIVTYIYINTPYSEKLTLHSLSSTLAHKSKMPVSHLTLTVSNLPTSTSFFLSCLQPLGYCFMGRHENSVGFGTEPGKPADFWIAEERPGVPAGAAHIAFPAPSRDAVSAFFIAALKAGGKIHGEPCVRDAERNYFSAAVIDFDGNSIEAVHRNDAPSVAPSRKGSVVNDKALTVVDNGSVVSKHSTKSRAMTVAPAKSEVSVAKSRAMTVAAPAKSEVSSASTAKRMSSKSVMAPAPQQPQAPRPQLSRQETTSTTTTTNVHYIVTKEKSGDNLSGAKAVVGTLLGAAAGAALAYAMVKGDSQSQQETITPVTTTRYIEAAPPQSSPSVSGGSNTGYRGIEAGQQQGQLEDGYARSAASKNPWASTVFEGLEQTSRILEQAKSFTGSAAAAGGFLPGTPGSTSGSERRPSDGSMYSGASGDLEIRAIEGVPGGAADDSRSSYSRTYPHYQPSPSFVSSFHDHPDRDRGDAGSACSSGSCGSQRRHGQQHYAKSVASSQASGSTIKAKSTKAKSSYSSHSKHSSKNDRDRGMRTIEEDYGYDFEPSVHSSVHSARNIPLPAGSTTTVSKLSIRSKHSHTSSSHSKHSHHEYDRERERERERDRRSSASSSHRSSSHAHQIPLPPSVAGGSALYLEDIDAGSHVTPRPMFETASTSSKKSKHKRSKSSSRASQSGHSSSGRSKFDDPVLPSDSVSQVGSCVSKKSSRSRR